MTTAMIAFTLKVVNTHPHPMTLVLEPWGETFSMAVGAQVEIDWYGPEGGTPEVVLAEETVTVWGWEGSVATLRNTDQITKS
jgi:hypothetical protein